MPVFEPADLEMNINGVVRTGLFPIGRTVTVANGNAVFYLTDDNTPTGNALFKNLVTVMIRPNEVGSSFSSGPYTLSADKKTVTIAVSKSTATNVALIGLSVLTAPAPANGSTIEGFFVGELA